MSIQKNPPIPERRTETLRRELIRLLKGHYLTQSEIAFELGIRDREVQEHLIHIQKSVSKRGGKFRMKPPECLRCGFVFRKREKMKKPGRCPLCKSRSISEPLFSIE
jgi:hypothetical protein